MRLRIVLMRWFEDGECGLDVYAVSLRDIGVLIGRGWMEIITLCFGALNLLHLLMVFYDLRGCSNLSHGEVFSGFSFCSLLQMRVESISSMPAHHSQVPCSHH